MRPEELLKPRYIVKADYPDSGYPVNSIIEFVDIDSYDNWCTKGGVIESFFTHYPHLFRRLEWWEYREEKDMPEYVKCIIDCRIPDNTILKANWETNCGFISHRGKNPNFWIDSNYFYPATLEEYTSFINQSTKGEVRNEK